MQFLLITQHKVENEAIKQAEKPLEFTIWEKIFNQKDRNIIFNFVIPDEKHFISKYIKLLKTDIWRLVRNLTVGVRLKMETKVFETFTCKKAGNNEVVSIKPSSIV